MGVERKNVINTLLVFLPMIFAIFAVPYSLLVRNNGIVDLMVASYLILIYPLYPVFMLRGAYFKKTPFFYALELPRLIVANLSLYLFFGIINYPLGTIFDNGVILLLSTMIFITGLVGAFLLYGRRYIGSERRSECSFTGFIISEIGESKGNSGDDTATFFPENFTLFVLFSILAGVLLVIRFPYIFGDDPWLHAAIVKNMIESESFARTADYKNLFGLYIVGTYFCNAGGIDPLVFARYFPVVTVVSASLIGFALMYYFLGRDQVAILGGLLFILSPLDAGLAFGQFWPTSLALILGFGNMLFSPFIEYRKHVTGSSFRISLLFFFLTISPMVILHDFTAYFILAGYIFIYILKYLRGSRSAFKMIVLYIISPVPCLLFRIVMGISPVSGLIMRVFSFPWYVYPCAGLCAAALLYYLGPITISDKKRLIDGYDNDLPPIPDTGFSELFFKKKLFIAATFVSAAIGGIIGYLFETEFGFARMDVWGTSLNAFFASFMLIITAGTMAKLRSNHHRSDLLINWVIFFGIAWLVLFTADMLYFHYFYWSRILIIAAAIIGLGFASYFFLLERKKLLNRSVIRKCTVVFMLSLIFAFSLYNISNHWAKNSAEVRGCAVASSFIPKNDGLLITGFRWKYVFNYYTDFGLNISVEDAKILHPVTLSEYYNNGSLKEIVEDWNVTNLYLLYDSFQVEYGIRGLDEKLFTHLDKDDPIEVNNLPGLDRIFSLKSEGDTFMYIYWVIVDV